MLETLIKDDPVIGKAHNQYEKFTNDDKMRELYDAHIKYERDKNTLYEIGKNEGIKEKALEDAKKMKQDGLSLEKISEYTGLTIEEIEKL